MFGIGTAFARRSLADDICRGSITHSTDARNQHFWTRIQTSLANALISDLKPRLRMWGLRAIRQYDTRCQCFEAIMTITVPSSGRLRKEWEELLCYPDQSGPWRDGSCHSASRRAPGGLLCGNTKRWAAV